MTKAEERISFSKLSVNEVASRLSVVLGNLLPAVGVHHCLVTLAGLPDVDMDIQFGFHNTMKFMMPCHLVGGQNLSWIRDPWRRMEVLEERERAY